MKTTGFSTPPQVTSIPLESRDISGASPQLHITGLGEGAAITITAPAMTESADWARVRGGRMPVEGCWNPTNHNNDDDKDNIAAVSLQDLGLEVSCVQYGSGF